MDRHSGIPLFLQLTQALRETLTSKVKVGALMPGDFFTTEKAICQRFGVSTITAKRALDDLEVEGIVTRQRGRGTYVAYPRVNQILNHFYRFTTEMRVQGLRPAWKNLYIGVVTPEPKVAEALRIGELEKVTPLDRVRLLDGEPFFRRNRLFAPNSLPGPRAKGS